MAASEAPPDRTAALGAGQSTEHDGGNDAAILLGHRLHVEDDGSPGGHGSGFHHHAGIGDAITRLFLSLTAKERWLDGYQCACARRA